MLTSDVRMVRVTHQSLRVRAPALGACARSGVRGGHPVRRQPPVSQWAEPSIKQGYHLQTRVRVGHDLCPRSDPTGRPPAEAGARGFAPAPASAGLSQSPIQLCPRDMRSCTTELVHTRHSEMALSLTPHAIRGPGTRIAHHRWTGPQGRANARQSSRDVQRVGSYIASSHTILTDRKDRP